jgi:2-dehydro-3-deoxy-D-gluconate 5-dehydrogenase
MTTTQQSLADLVSLKGQTALVTGGAKGIGAGICERLAEAGAQVCVTDIDEAAGQAVAKKVGGHFFLADAASVADARRVVDQCVAATGRLDILVNNAGIFPMSPALQTTEELWDKVLDVNLKGAFFFAQATAKHLTDNKRPGSIINIASIDALHPTGALVHYDASKGGMLMMTKSLAVEFGKSGIRVNVICPGSIKTPGADEVMGSVVKAMGITPEQMSQGFLQRVPLGRTGTPDDIALATLFYASPLSSYVTGDVMVVDGGYLLS